MSFLRPTLSCLLAATLLAGTAMPAQAGMPLSDSLEATPPADRQFAGAFPLEDSELAELRGGFVFGELTIDFGLISNTFVDGGLVNETALDSNSYQQALVDGLTTIIQVGNQNAVIDTGLLDSLPGLVTVIQNSTSDTIIQQVDIIDLKAVGLDDFTVQNLSPLLDYQTANAI